MNICMIVEDYPPQVGGGGLFVHELSKRLVSSHEITVITPAYNLPEREETEDKIKIIRVGSGRVIFFLKALLHLLRSPKFDIYHAHGALPGLLAKILSVIKRGRVILHIHGYREKSVIGPLKYFGQNLILKLGYDKIISVDKISSRKIEALGIPKDKIATIPAGVDTEKFFPTKKSKNPIPIFLFVGRLVEVKDLLTLLKAAKLLQEQNIQAKFWIVGEGKLKNKLQDFIEKNRIRNIKFLGRIPHEKINGIYNKADFFVLPSLSEGNPLVLLEAMACGLPIIASDIDNLLEISEKSNSAFTFNSGNPQSLAKTVMRVLNLSEKEYLSLGKNARRYVEENFSWEKAANAIDGVYDKVLKYKNT